MNNEPVAWTACLDCGKRVIGDSIHTCSPQLKTLTDEEIMNIFNNWTNRKQEHNLPAGNIDYFHQEMIEFARAILRKAQEK
jgi:hypothetical protein